MNKVDFDDSLRTIRRMMRGDTTVESDRFVLLGGAIWNIRMNNILAMKITLGKNNDSYWVVRKNTMYTPALSSRDNVVIDDSDILKSNRRGVLIAHGDVINQYLNRFLRSKVSKDTMIYGEDEDLYTKNIKKNLTSSQKNSFCYFLSNEDDISNAFFSGNTLYVEFN